MVLKILKQSIFFFVSLLFSSIVYAQEKADFGAGSLFGSATDILIPVLKLLSIGVVIIFFLALIFAMWYFLQRKKSFKIPISIYMLTSEHNIMKDFDFGAVVKMHGGGKRLIFKKNKYKTPVPSADCWIPLFRGGGASLEFIQVGSGDIHPLTRKFIEKKGATKDGMLKAIKDLYKKEYPDKFIDKNYSDAFIESIDVQSKLKDVEIRPIPADLKSHMAMEAEENLLKHQWVNKIKELVPMVIIILTLAFLTFAIIWHYKYVDILSTKTINSGEDYLKQCNVLIGKACGISVPAPVDVLIEGAEPPPI